MAVDERDVRKAPETEPRSTGLGLIKGLGVTLKHALRPSITQQYPEVKPDLPPRTRGVIALKEANCTVCYKCSRECPDWCIYIDAHKETHEPASGGKGRSMKVLDRFAIDYALCMYCGICVEVCPFDALFWSPEFEYAEYDIVELTRPPFDMPVADSEIIFGAYTEYTGLKFAFFLLAEYGGIVALSAIASVLFLGGYLPLPKMEFIPDPLWMLAKIGALSFLIIWLRVTYPRLREDQLQRASWLVLIPLALLQIVVVAVFKVAF
jgi:NADH-quinone oxidoreductase subunit I